MFSGDSRYSEITWSVQMNPKGHSFKERPARPDCRIIDISVPVRSSPWSGTGTVVVSPPSTLCIIMWPPSSPYLGEPMHREYCTDLSA